MTGKSSRDGMQHARRSMPADAGMLAPGPLPRPPAGYRFTTVEIVAEERAPATPRPFAPAGARRLG